MAAADNILSFVIYL